jgi:hypothetical protein
LVDGEYEEGLIFRASVCLKTVAYEFFSIDFSQYYIFP